MADFIPLDYSAARKRIRFQYWLFMGLMISAVGIFLTIGYLRFPPLRPLTFLLGGVVLLGLGGSLVSRLRNWPEIEMVNTAEKLGIRLRASRKGENYKLINPPDYEAFFGEPDGEIEWQGKKIGVSQRETPFGTRDARYHFFAKFNTQGVARTMTIFEISISDPRLNLMLTQTKRGLGSYSAGYQKVVGDFFSKKTVHQMHDWFERKTVELPKGWFGIFWDKDDPIEEAELKDRLGKICGANVWDRLNSLNGEHTVVLQNGKLRLLASGWRSKPEEIQFYLDFVAQLAK